MKQQLQKLRNSLAVIALSAAFSGCAEFFPVSPRYPERLAFTVDSDPKYAVIYNASGRRCGECPTTLHFDVNPGEESQSHILRQIEARWRSGAKLETRLRLPMVMTTDQTSWSDGVKYTLHGYFVVSRPSDAPDAEIDLDYEVGRRGLEIQQKTAEAANRSAKAAEAEESRRAYYDWKRNAEETARQYKKLYK